MNHRIRLVFGQKVDAPFANSVLVCALLALILAAGSALMWADALDTLGVTREGAAAREITVASAQATGEGGYAPRLEVVGEGGETFALLRSAVGEGYDALCGQIQPGDELTLRLSRRGNVLEVEREGEILVPFDDAVARGRGGMILNLAAAVLFDALAVLVAVRAAVLAMNRKSQPRAGRG